MGIYIKGMELPKANDEMIEIAILGDGTVIQTGESWRSPEDGKCYYRPTTPEKFFHADKLPPHRRLCDADALEQDALKRLLMCDKNDNQFQRPYEVIRAIALAPTVIPAEETEP